MEKLEKFMNELKETLNYSEKATVISEEWGETLYKISICNVNILFNDTIKILAKWEIQELYNETNGDYAIIIGFQK